MYGPDGTFYPIYATPIVPPSGTPTVAAASAGGCLIYALAALLIAVVL